MSPGRSSGKRFPSNRVVLGLMADERLGPDSCAFANDRTDLLAEVGAVLERASEGKLELDDEPIAARRRSCAGIAGRMRHLSPSGVAEGRRWAEKAKMPARDAPVISIWWTPLLPRGISAGVCEPG